jgi:hypothetical protein
MQMQQRGFGGCGLESWWLRRWAASSDRLAGRGQGTAQANWGSSKGAGRARAEQTRVSSVWDETRDCYHSARQEDSAAEAEVVAVAVEEAEGI